MTTAKDEDHLYLLAQHLVAKEIGDSEEALRSKLAIERALETAADWLRKSAGNPDAQRIGLVGWLSVFDTYLRIALPDNEDGRLQGPLSLLACILWDLHNGIKSPIVTAKGKRSGPHGLQAVNFKVAAVLLADEAHAASRKPGRKRCERRRDDVDQEIFMKVRKYAPAYGLKMTSTWLTDCRTNVRRAVRKARPSDPIYSRVEDVKRVLMDKRETGEDTVAYLLSWITDRSKFLG
jgi:hypothetical protein